MENLKNLRTKIKISYDYCEVDRNSFAVGVMIYILSKVGWQEALDSLKVFLGGFSLSL